uniref:Ligatin n=1 Tax=Ascaris suum TaxID=6253 RepID=F1KYL4_ASCSU
MFRKSFVVKSNTNMRNSDRRKLLSRLHFADRISSKAQVAHVRLLNSNGVPLNVYTFDKNPLLFEMEDDPNLYPTVYFTWISPESFPCLLVREQVLSFLENGADLMLPGVIYRRGAFPEFERNYPVTISVVTNNGHLKGPVGVGVALMSSMEMIANGMQGRGVQILHLYRDFLWEFGSRAHPPQIPVPATVVTKPLSEEDFPALDSLTTANEPNRSVEEEKKSEATNGMENVISDEQLEQQEPAVEPEPETMEDLLRRCFIAALKYRVTKKAELPLDVGEFYSRYLLPCVPPTRRIDMKKTKFKKFSVFLNEINSNGDGPIVKITSKSKGVDAIAEINWSHPLLVGFEKKDEVTEDMQAEVKPRIRIDEYFAITEPVLPLFRIAAGLSKGDLIETPRAREIITSYVKNRNLTEKNKVILRDDVLNAVVKHDSEAIDWNTLIQKILSRMTKTFVIVTPDGRQMMRKVELPKIAFKVETRSGNKKMTLVNNLSLYGIECKPFCQQVQVGIATSATVVNDAQGCEGPQVTIQGNQVQFVSELLLNEYGVDKKYMSGLDLIPKKRK